MLVKQKMWTFSSADKTKSSHSYLIYIYHDIWILFMTPNPARLWTSLRYVEYWNFMLQRNWECELEGSRWRRFPRRTLWNTLVDTSIALKSRSTKSGSRKYVSECNAHDSWFSSPCLRLDADPTHHHHRHLCCFKFRWMKFLHDCHVCLIGVREVKESWVVECLPATKEVNS